MAIENISDTARWVAVYRAMETARPDAIFHDPFADRLAGPPSLHWVDVDLPGILNYKTEALRDEMERTWGKSLAASGAPFRFAPAEGTEFFRPYGWREVEFRSMWEEGRRLKRTMKGAWFWNLIGRLYPKRVREGFRRFSGIVLLERV